MFDDDVCGLSRDTRTLSDDDICGLWFVQREQRDFLKQFGRKDVKDSRELTEKGDLNNANIKLMTKIKKMAGPLAAQYRQYAIEART